MLEELVFLGNYAYLVEAELVESEFSLMISEIYRTNNIQETTIRYGGKIVSCFFMG